ncbi:MAG: 3-isopropylmalate dehydratase large subunit [Betaproteobacteria bacterium]|nr:3-isopropylmalate dehydratase large subunit [Betaproteobacteria bacterium]
MCAAMTMFDKIWDMHVVGEREDGEQLMYVDYNVVSEGPFYAFNGLRQEGRGVRHPDKTLAMADHYAPTTGRDRGIDSVADPEARVMIEQLAVNTAWAGITRHYGLTHPQQGIMHVVPAELGMPQPGMIITGADSHTSTNGAFGACGFGLGASQVKHVLATQTIWLRKPKPMRVWVDGTLGGGVSAKDVILAIIARIGVGGGVGFALEYAGSAIRGLSMEGRMTLCNMSIEAGARMGMVAPDGKTFEHLRGRELAPQADEWAQAEKFWRSLLTDEGAQFPREARLQGDAIEPMATWGTSLDEAGPVGGRIPDPGSFADPGRRGRAEKALAYMGLTPGMPIADIQVDRVFIGSCTNARLEDLRAAAKVARGRKARVPAMVVPGSMTVKRRAEEEGLHEVFLRAGFEWRDPGCSMCVSANGDRLAPGERSASTSNRNFEGRQGRGSRTHIVSPAMAAAAAVSGRLADVRDFL